MRYNDCPATGSLTHPAAIAEAAAARQYHGISWLWAWAQLDLQARTAAAEPDGSL